MFKRILSRLFKKVEQKPVEAPSWEKETWDEVRHSDAYQSLSNEPDKTRELINLNKEKTKK